MSKSKRNFLLSILLALCLMLGGCMTNGQTSEKVDTNAAEKPKLPEKLELNSDGVPLLKVYDIKTEKIEEMDLEEYVMGVVAGEMKNDWPEEALRAQAILARTFVLKFCDTKKSRFEGADISTDVSEAQAYAPDSINDRVRKAVEGTRGEVMSYEGTYPYAWFFAHSGGKTELPSVALDFKGKDPAYLAVTTSQDSEKAPDDVKNWTAVFTLQQVQDACNQAGTEVGGVESVEVGERGESGRAKTLKINGKEVSGPSFRIAIGANKLKSTMIESIDMADGKVTFTGSGFGHGVGMSQWGAYAMAEQGKKAEEIIQYYFKDTAIVKLWS